MFSDSLAAFKIHVLEFSVTEIEIRALVSLTVSDSASIAASKIKGRLSKWISNHLETNSNAKQKWLARGYFATTTGKSTTEEISAYLERQGEHRGYDPNPQSPIYVHTFDRTEADEQLLETDHAVSRLRYHVVFVTECRHGVFSAESAALIVERWRAMQTELKIVIQKVAVLPDHIHLSIDFHPAVMPVSILPTLMNAAQNLMLEKFESALIQAKLNRLWQPSAYLGSFGDLKSAAIANYVKRWESLEGP